MSSLGFDRTTFKPLVGFAHVVMNIHVIVITPIGSRIMRREFGSSIPALLGASNVTQPALLRFCMAIILAVSLWERRFAIRRFAFPEAFNTPELRRQGKIGIRLIGDYMPRALDGDFTVENPEAEVDL
jgi:hypothetical protein